MQVAVEVWDPESRLPADAAASASAGVMALIGAGLSLDEIAEDIVNRVGVGLACAEVLPDGAGRVTVTLRGLDGGSSHLDTLSTRGGEARATVRGWNGEARVGKRWILEAAVEAADLALAAGRGAAAASAAAVAASFGEFESARIRTTDCADFDVEFTAAP